MSDTRIENAIVEAIQIIADQKIADANFDKTIKAVIAGVLDQSTGKYLIKYQDSTFQAYATSSNVHYLEGQVVYVQIPSNDWDKNKTILSGEQLNGTVYKQVPVADDMYNSIGANGISSSNSIEISSYHGTDTWKNLDITFNDDIQSYIRQGDSISLGMTVQTKFASSQQSNGQYGIRFILEFIDSETGESVLRSFDLDSTQVIGNPYGLIKPTNVSSLITGIDTQHFVRISSIQAFCTGFAEGTDSQKNINDIIFSNIRINGATALSQQELEGYSLHINCPKGFTLKNDITQLQLIAELKNGGKIINQGVTYYWFRQNAMTFRGSNNWNGYAGDGWECLNYKPTNDFVGKDYNNFYINGNSTDDLFNNRASIKQKVNKILCVAVYGNSTFSKEIKLYNDNISDNVKIVSSDTLGEGINRQIYYLDNGNPTLTCVYQSEEKKENLIYTWLVKSERGGAVQPSSNQSLYNDYTNVKKNYDQYIEKKSSMAIASANEYEKNNETIIKAWQDVKNNSFVYKNIYYNFPIKEIFNKTVISCSVSDQDGTYLGTGSITLYNKKQLQDMYQLQLINGTQVFQYDGKGNSPASKQLDKPITISPVSFSLFDDKGNEITHDQIRTNGLIKWIIPNTQTLLVSNQKQGQSGEEDITVNSADLALPASSYTVYSSLDSFDYSIVDRYDAKNTQNDIWLHVEFKDLVFDAYTDFTFPKDGDPGTNGTDYVAKIIPKDSTTDRLYLSTNEKNILFDDDGDSINQIEFWIYNNSKGENRPATFWQAPPQNKGTTYLTLSDTDDNNKSTKPILQNISKKQADVDKTWYNLLGTSGYLPIDIIRAQLGSGDDILKYYAEYPICVNFLQDTKSHYRFKIKPKTGFKYVVYASDGTSPNYDNTLPFEIIVEKFDDKYYSKGQEDYTYNWKVIGNLSIKQKNGKYCTVEPKDTFDGLDLTSAVVCQIKSDNKSLGCLHVPIYMILNRYNICALNDWDGNSIDLGKNGETILAPQIGAGKKQSDNSYTGIFMGDVKSNSTSDIGLMGYQHGTRSIFLDATTGNATFGKPGAAQIKITANSGEGTIQSGDYNYNTFNHNGTGMKIKFSSTGSGSEKGPYIRYGSNKFSVNSDGSIHAAGSGDIAGWTISDDKIFKHTTPGNWAGMASQNWITNDIGGNLPNETDTVAFYAGETHYTKTTDTEIKSRSYYTYDSDSKKYKKVENPKKEQLKNYYNHYNNRNNFYVTHNGFLFAKYGQIAGWNFNDKTLSKSNVGMNSDASNSTYIPTTTKKINGKNVIVQNWPDGKDHDAKAFFANGDNFYVTHDGYLLSQSGKIGNWNISASELSNIDTSKNKLVLSPTAGISIINGTDNTKKFTVNNEGYLTSTSGKIGGWNITTNKLWAGNEKANTTGIRLNSDGSMEGGKDPSAGKGWAIYSDGSSSFNKITARNATIDEANITNGHFETGDFGTNEGSKITIKNGGIYGSGFRITPTYSYFTGLYTDNKGVSTNYSGSSNMGMTADGGYLVPSAIGTDAGGGGLSLRGYMEALFVKKLYAETSSTAIARLGQLYIYPDMSVNAETGTSSHGTTIKYSFTNTGVHFGSSQSTISELVVNGYKGLSAQINFNNDTYIKVEKGIIYEAKDQKGTVHKAK